jgi:oligopeptide/dipeptide ABC transporter ATP-binding protein
VTTLVDVVDLDVRYGAFAAVREATFAIAAGTTLALVGESGSGKSSIALAVSRLLPSGGTIAGGTIRIGDTDVTALGGGELRRARGSLVGYLAQDSMAALNPLLRTGRQVAESYQAREGVSRRAAQRSAVEILGEVGIQRPETVAQMYPHELSGGMRQRVMIAMALALRPRLLIADEPTTALDVTVQAEILVLARELQAEHGVTFLWITHDMGVVAEVAHDVAVMYGGRIVEQGPATEVFARPAHPYTRALLAIATAGGDGEPKAPFPVIGGAPPAGVVPAGCPFHPRCGVAIEPCSTADPAARPVADGHTARCHLVGSTGGGAT